MFSASSEGDSRKHNNGFLRLPCTFRRISWTTVVAPQEGIHHRYPNLYMKLMLIDLTSKTLSVKISRKWFIKFSAKSKLENISHFFNFQLNTIPIGQYGPVCGILGQEWRQFTFVVPVYTRVIKYCENLMAKLDETLSASCNGRGTHRVWKLTVGTC